MTGTGMGASYTFIDDFTGPAGSAPDPAKWSFDIGDGGWGNDELQTYTSTRENSFLDGAGHLVVRATKAVDPGTGAISYQSARLKTQSHFAQRLGHWEARLKIDSARGLWPAWWTLGQNISSVGWPRCGEIDMVEDYGFSTVESSVHTAGGPRGFTSYSASVPNDQDFHVFRMDWSESGISFLRDGVPHGTLSWPASSGGMPVNPDQPMFMLLNVAVGGSIGAPPPDTVFPADLVVDYVRVWT
jgi:beta-glucanase (GH16 family)